MIVVLGSTKVSSHETNFVFCLVEKYTFFSNYNLTFELIRTLVQSVTSTTIAF